MTVIKVLALCAVGFLAGAWTLGTFVVVPAQRELTATVYAAVEQANTSFGQRYLPVLSGSSVVLLSTLLFVDRHRRSLNRGLLTAAGVLIVVTVVFTAAVMVPLNAEVDSWSVQAPPVDWQQTRDAWHTGQAFRTLLAVPAFVLVAIAIVRGEAHRPSPT